MRSFSTPIEVSEDGYMVLNSSCRDRASSLNVHGCPEVKSNERNKLFSAKPLNAKAIGLQRLFLFLHVYLSYPQFVEKILLLHDFGCYLVSFFSGLFRCCFKALAICLSSFLLRITIRHLLV